MSTRVLVTGATGFVGAALLPALQSAGHEVVALVRTAEAFLPAGVTRRLAPPIETLSVADWQDLLAGIDAVIHLAAIAHIGKDVPEERYDAVNHLAVARLAEAMERQGTSRLVFLSSIRAQCGASSTRLETETCTPAPTDAYGRAKLAAERAIAARRIDSIILRPVLIVGDAPKGNLSLLLRLARLPLPLPLGGLSGRRSLVSRDDVVALMVRALSDAAMSGGTFVVADPEPLSMAEMLGLLRHGMGRGPGLFALPAALLSLPFRLVGRKDLWERIASPLEARPQALIRLGFRPIRPMREVLPALAGAAR